MRTITYFSPWLKSLSRYKKVWQQIETAMHGLNELYDFVPEAKDLWVRDFMPLQRHDGEFIIYRYSPDYLQGKYSRYITNCRDAFLQIGGRSVLSSGISHNTNLVIDGGNAINCVDRNGVDCVVMTAKVLYENPGLTHHEILIELEDIFEAEVIIVPWDTSEEFGHADGMVRSLGEGRLLLNCYSDMDSSFGAVLKKSLSGRFDLEYLEYGKLFSEKSWCHINYLELRDAVLVPLAGIESDLFAIELIEKFTGKNVIPISMSPVVSDGGAMHCISWTMKTDAILENKIVFGHPMFEPQCH